MANQLCMPKPPQWFAPALRYAVESLEVTGDSWGYSMQRCRCSDLIHSGFREPLIERLRRR
jgi:hypothetical protein